MDGRSGLHNDTTCVCVSARAYVCVFYERYDRRVVCRGGMTSVCVRLCVYVSVLRAVNLSPVR